MPKHIQILKSYNAVSPHISTIRTQADANRIALGFLPGSAYDELAFQNKVWVAISDRTKECLGHLMFGGSFPTIKIFQTLVYPSGQGHGIGRQLIESLIEHAEDRYYLNITANVAEDLPANAFWEKCGFPIIRQKPGGHSSGRTINVRIRQLNTPSLFNFSSAASKPSSKAFDGIKCCGRSIKTNPTYVLDLNVIFDVIKKRVHSKQAGALITASMNGHLQIRITPEIEAELMRHSSDSRPDPVLEFVKTMPTLPLVDEKTLQPLLKELGPIVFPDRTISGSQTIQDKSDLRHLAIAIHHRMSGFITREKAILSTHETLLNEYGLDVLSPSDFEQPFETSNAGKHKVSAVCGNEDMQIASGREEERNEIEEFLLGLGLSRDSINTTWDPGATGYQRKRITFRSGGTLTGIASWDLPSKFVRKVRLFVLVCEEHSTASQIFDHAFDSILRDFPSTGFYFISFLSPTQQPLTQNAAMQRGFIKIEQETGLSGTCELVKSVRIGSIRPASWPEFAKQYEDGTGLCLPKQMPSYDNFLSPGINISSKNGLTSKQLNLYDFETLMSPSLILCPGRGAIILPIHNIFANELFQGLSLQQGLFAEKEAFLHSEKAYFKSPKGLSLFTIGRPVFFYVSGTNGGMKTVVGHGRITSSSILSICDADRHRAKQGVLTYAGLKKLANKSGQVLVITFDNFCRLPSPIPFATLKKENLVSKANLITAQALDPNALIRICELGYDETNQ